jgi:flagellar motor switch protein FliN
MTTIEKTTSPTVQQVELPPSPQEATSGPALLDGNLSLVAGVKVSVEVVVGNAQLSIGELFALQSGSVVKLDQMKDAPVALRLDGKVVALGKLVVVDENFGIRITEIDTTKSSDPNA